MHLNDARAVVQSRFRALGPEEISLDESLGRVPAVSIRAGCSLPKEPRSRLDGYAVRSRDTKSATPERPLLLRVLPHVLAAGHVAACELEPGECMRIMTGAVLPGGADGVLAQEAVTFDDGRLMIDRGSAAGDGVVLPGSEVREGERVLERGEVLNPTRMAMLAALGLERISVVRKPRVAFLSTGDEVRELGGTLDGMLTHCNTRYLLAWAALQQGALPIHLGTAGDEPEAVAEKLAQTDAELVISTGGMGRGDRDFVLEAWSRLGIQVHFSEINLMPGRRSACGIRNGQVFWGLPGNPWGAQVVFNELVVPLLWRMQGVQAEGPVSVKACLMNRIKKKSEGFQAVRGVLKLEEAEVRFLPGVGRGASLFAGLRQYQAYALLEDRVREMVPGEQVLVRFNDFPLLASPLFSVVR